MDILSQKTLAILRDEKVGKALDELLEFPYITDTKIVKFLDGTCIRIRRIY